MSRLWNWFVRWMEKQAEFAKCEHQWNVYPRFLNRTSRVCTKCGQLDVDEDGNGNWKMYQQGA